MFICDIMIWIALIICTGVILFFVNFLFKQISHLHDRIDYLQNENNKLSQKIEKLTHVNSEVNPNRYASKDELSKSLNDIYQTLIVHQNFIIKDDERMLERFKNALKQIKNL